MILRGHFLVERNIPNKAIILLSKFSAVLSCWKSSIRIGLFELPLLIGSSKVTLPTSAFVTIKR